MRRIRPSVLTNYLIVFILVFCIFNVKFWKKPDRVINWDVISYYAYLPATFIYDDLTLKFTDHYSGPHHFIFWPSTAPNGGKVIKTSMGLAMLYSPFFFCGHIAAHFLGYDTGGYSPPYKFALIMSCLFYLMLGLIFLRKLLLRYFSEIVTSITLFSVVIGTNLLYYASFEAALSHAYSFSLICIFLYLTVAYHDFPSLGKAVLVGLLLGIISLIRPTNILVILFFLLWNVKSLMDLKSRLIFFIRKYRHVLIMTTCFVLVWLPQMFYWKKVTGQWLYFSYGNERFFFNHPHLLQGLFGFRKGWFLYTPLMLVSVASISFLWKKHRGFFLPVTVFTGINIYVILSWWAWWYGGCFGQRAFIDSYGIMAFPLAVFIDWGLESKRFIRCCSLSLVAICSLLSIFYTCKYYYGSIHWDSMTKETFFDSYFRIRPSTRFWSLLESPDYDKALSGIDAVISKEKANKEKTVVPINYKICGPARHYLCDVERLSADKKYLHSTANFLQFENNGIRSTLHSYSGKYSVMVNKINPFGMTAGVEVHEGDTLQVCIRRYGHKGYLVIQGTTASEYYQAQGQSSEKDRNGWEKMTMGLISPKQFSGTKFKIYVWNPDTDKVYFDDLEIIMSNRLN